MFWVKKGVLFLHRLWLVLNLVIFVHLKLNFLLLEWFGYSLEVFIKTRLWGVIASWWRFFGREKLFVVTYVENLACKKARSSCCEVTLFIFIDNFWSVIKAPWTQSIQLIHPVYFAFFESWDVYMIYWKNSYWVDVIRVFLCTVTRYALQEEFIFYVSSMFILSSGLSDLCIECHTYILFDILQSSNCR